MRILVTRPEPEASDLARRLTALGHQVLVQPMMRIVLGAEPADLPPPAAIAVTSRNGVRALAGWPKAAGWRGLPVYAVGEASAATARAAGFADVRTGAGDATALAGLIRAGPNPPHGPILYPAGRDRAADLAALLPGLPVVTVEAYRGEAAAFLDAPVRAAIAAGAIDAALFYSRRTAAIFAALVAAEPGFPAGLSRATFLAISPAVAAALAPLGAASIRVASRPDEAALLALIDPTLAHPS